ncbi:hypothetical protein IPM65_04020 [Candidatus Roizmanbacteria bacterium]|nr:MAG: hypothetical protein IPM65_04020 [Candidatus Roizmanbacteria bacterium]
MKNNIIGFFKAIKQRFFSITRKPSKKIMKFASVHPFATLFALLGLLLILIVVGNMFRQPEETEKQEEQEAKSVQVYRIGEPPKMTVQAQVEKSGVVTITALSPGVVQNIYYAPGDYVAQGSTLLTTSTNYQGGNAAYLQSRIAARQLQNINETYDTQKEIIAKQKEIANKTDQNADELRNISQKSIEETKGMIDVNDSALKMVETIIADLETGGATDTQILPYIQQKSQILSALNQLRSGLRNTEYSIAGDKPQAELSNLQKDITIKQLEIQEKALDLNRDVTKLQLQVSQVQAAMMYPSSPFNATVQRVLVKIGEAVNPGTPLMILSQEIEEDPIVAIAYVPREIALKTTYAEPSVLTIGTISYETYPSYISRDAVQGNLYGIFFPIPDSYHQYVTDDGYINVTIPIGYYDTSASVPYIPIDSVYQTQESSHVFVIENGKAVARDLTLGSVIGRFVEVEQGLESGDVIILDRNVVGGDKVVEK